MRQFIFTAVALAVLTFGPSVFTQASDPFDASNSAFQDWAPVLVNDDVMPTQTEIDGVRRMVDAAFAGSSEPTQPKDALEIVVQNQDYSALTVGATCIGERFDVGGKVVENGLGSHANSRLLVRSPEPIKRFETSVALNPRQPGSASCSVEANGEVCASTPTFKGGDKPIALVCEFAEPVSEFTIIFDTTEDGPANDQANLLNPTAVAASGKSYALCGDAFIARLSQQAPFSFTYGDRSSREFLADWTFEREAVSPLITRYSWTDPETKLTVSATVRYFERFAAADWVLNFTNNGDQETPVIADVQPLDASFDFGVDIADLTINTLSGDSCDAKSWSPVQHALKLDATKSFAPNGGRSSNGAFPFWNVTPRQVSDREPSDGLFFAIGWSGQWNASFSRPKSQQSKLFARAGMELFESVLYPGETIRTPRALVMPWLGNLRESQVLFRRLLMFEYAPKIADKPVQMEFISQCFDRYYRKRPGWEKCESQIESAKALKAIGGTAYWFDAAWFPLGFPNGVGNWYSDVNNFPNGVEELGTALEEMSLKFVLWFEPERVAVNSEIATKYPEFVFGGENGGLYKLNDPAARKHLTELLLKRIKEFKLDVYRNDFNIDPLSFWRDNDEENRKGMTETRYVEGHYEMWNRFLDENPGLWIDNCASGGRRIDLETISISVPLWRSDTCCWSGHPEWDQSHTIGVAQYLPLYSCSSWDSSPYTFRSAANPGAIMQYNFLDDDYDQAAAKKSLDEAKTYQKFWYGDFYPLTTAPEGKGSAVAWQLHRPDLNAGLVYIFRQPESPYRQVELELYAIDPGADYFVGVKPDFESVEKETISGKELQNFLVTMPTKGAAYVVEYQRVEK